MFKRKEHDPNKVKEFIIINENEEAFIGLKYGKPQFSINIDNAKTYNEQSKFDGMKRFHQHLNIYKLEI
jgi:hypothetical protein